MKPPSYRLCLALEAGPPDPGYGIREVARDLVDEGKYDRFKALYDLVFEWWNSRTRHTEYDAVSNCYWWMGFSAGISAMRNRPARVRKSTRRAA